MSGEHVVLDSVPVDIRPQSRMLLETEAWLVGVPLTRWAMMWWGGFTEWCTARSDGAFEQYHRQGDLIVFRSRVSWHRWMLHPATAEFRDRDNKRRSWRGFLMKNGDIAAGLMMALAQVKVRS